MPGRKDLLSMQSAVRGHRACIVQRARQETDAE